MQKLKYHVLKTINYEKEEMIPLSEEENKSYEEQDAKKKFILIKTMKMKIMKTMQNLKSIEKLKIIVITSGNLEKLLIGITI